MIFANNTRLLWRFQAVELLDQATFYQLQLFVVTFDVLFVLYCAFSCDLDGLGWERNYPGWSGAATVGATALLPAQKKRWETTIFRKRVTVMIEGQPIVFRGL